MQGTAQGNDDAATSNDNAKLFAWIGCYFLILLVTLVQYLRYRRERKVMDAELSNFEEVDSNDRSFLQASRFD